MPSSSFDRNVLVGTLAVRNGFITREDLDYVIEHWTRRNSQPLAEWLFELGFVSHEERERLESLVDSHIKAHNGDARKSLQSISLASDVAALFVTLADNRQNWFQRHPILTVVIVGAVAVELLAAIGFFLKLDRNDIAQPDLEQQQPFENAENQDRDPQSLDIVDRFAAGVRSQQALEPLTRTVRNLQFDLERAPADDRQSLVDDTMRQLDHELTQIDSKILASRPAMITLSEMAQQILVFDNGSRMNSALVLAERIYRRSLVIAEQNVREFPSSSDWQNDLSVVLDRLGNVCLRLGRQKDALTHYQRGLQICRNLAAADPKDTNLQVALAFSHQRVGNTFFSLDRYEEAAAQYHAEVVVRRLLANANPINQHIELGDSLEQLGDRFMKLGRYEEALIQFEAGLTINRELVEIDPDGAVRQRGLEIAFNKYGAVLQKFGRSTDALTQYQAGLKIARTLNEADPSNIEKQYDLSFSFSRLGDVFRELERYDDALSQYQEARVIRQRIVDANPSNEFYQHHLGIMFSRLGDVCIKLQRYDDALVNYQSTLTIDQKLAEVNPDNQTQQKSLSIALRQLGDALDKLQRYDEAVAMYQAALAIVRKLSEANFEIAATSNDLSYLIERLGDVFQELGRHVESLKYYQEDEALWRARSQADPSDSSRQRSLVALMIKVGDALRLLERNDAAVVQLNAAEKLSIQLAKDDPSSADKQRNVMMCHLQLGQVYQQTGRFEEAQQRFSQGINVLDAMIANGQFVEASQKEKEILTWHYQASVDAKTAVGDWDELLKLDPMALRKLMSLRGYEMSKRGDRARVLQVAEKLRDLQPKSKGQLYDAGCFYALAADLIIKDNPAPTDAENAERHKFLNIAIDCLKESIAAGWDNFAHMRKDKDLISLHGRPEFEALFPE